MIKMSKICLLIFRLLFLLEGGVWSLRNLSISVPRAALSGASREAVLRCEYELEGAPLYSLRWYRADTEFYRYVPREHPPSMVFPLPGTTVDLAHSDSRQVRLVGLHRRLSGLYQCEVSADAPLFHTDIRSAPLTVVDPPFLAPRLWVSRETYSRGAALSANCSVDEAYPAPNITWTLNDIPIATTVSALPGPEEYGERGAVSSLELTFSDDVTEVTHDLRSRYLITHSHLNEHSAQVYYAGEKRTMEQETSRLRVSVPANGAASGSELRCVAHILGVYERRSPPTRLHEDVPAHASVTRPGSHESRVMSSGSLLWTVCACVALRSL